MKPAPTSRPTKQPASTLPRLRSVEAAKFLEHQMYFWGKDVLHPAGNLLAAFGCNLFRRDEAPHPVHCYDVQTEHGRVILHSTGVLLQPAVGETGIAYLRPTHRLYHVPAGVVPLPCSSARHISKALRSVRSGECPIALIRLLQFVRDYEIWATSHLPARAREEAWREHRRTASHGIRWLPPADSARWLELFLRGAVLA